MYASWPFALCSLKQFIKNSTYWTESSREYRKISWHEKYLSCSPVCRADLTQRAREASRPRGGKQVSSHYGATDYIVTMIWSRAFRLRSGTVASLLGYPTGSNTSSFSCEGRPRSSLRRGPQLRGVVVTVTSPAFWNKREQTSTLMSGKTTALSPAQCRSHLFYSCSLVIAHWSWVAKRLAA